MQVPRVSLLLAFLLVLCHFTASLFVPSHLVCGSSNDVKAVTSFPHSITSTPNGGLSYGKMTWEKPMPTNNFTLILDSETVGYIFENYTYFEEVDGLNTSVIYESFDLYNLSFEAATTKLPTCSGFYLRANLSNGGILEYLWYLNYEEIDEEFTGRTYKLKPGDARLYILLSNYPYTAEVSAPNSKFTFFISSPFEPLGVWESYLGSGPPFIGENDAAAIATVLTPPTEKTKNNGYIMTHGVLSNTIPYYSEKNGVQSALATKVRGRANQLDNNLEIMSVDASDTYGGFPYTQNDTMLSLKFITFTMEVEQVDNSDNSSANMFVIPSIKTILLSIVVFIALFHW